ncbi:hypothetical protein LCGC14_0388890 [marine sediment metagenome]|uniref:Uncharacterized protein n=1 Tax=marine sediment metagenome TaxID=412755 RepID=A0A0F9TIG0_9ZZZZ
MSAPTRKEFMALTYEKYVEMKAQIYTLDKKGQRLRESHNKLIEVLEHVKNDVVWNEPKSPTLAWIKKTLNNAEKLSK